VIVLVLAELFPAARETEGTGSVDVRSVVQTSQTIAAAAAAAPLAEPMRWLGRRNMLHSPEVIDAPTNWVALEYW
jgi:hypothetical protein